MPADNVLNLNTAINTTKKGVDDLAGGVDKLSSGFDRLAQTLRVSAYIELNSTYTKLTRNIALTHAEAEKLSFTVEKLSKLTQTYSRQELANMTSMLYKSTGAIMTVRKDFDMLSERFATKYKKDADIYMQSLVRLTEQMPDVSVAMQKGTKDIGTLTQIMRVSGREGVSAYLAAIDVLPDEVENSINKTELQVKRLQSTWSNAKVELGKSTSAIYGYFEELGTIIGGFAQTSLQSFNVLKTMGSLAVTFLSAKLAAAPIKSALSSLGLGAVGAAGAAGTAASVVGAAGTAASVIGAPGYQASMANQVGGYAYHTGKNFNVVDSGRGSWANRLGRTKFAGGYRAAAGLAGGAAIFAGGHALNDAYNEGGIWGQFGTNMAAGAAVGSMYGPAGTIIGASVGAVGTTAKEAIATYNDTKDANAARRKAIDDFGISRSLARYKAKGFDEAMQAEKQLKGNESYVDSGDISVAAAKKAQEQATEKSKAVADAEVRVAEYKKLGLADMQKYAQEQVRQAKEQQRDALAQGTESSMKANLKYERAKQISGARVGQLQQAVQFATQYGGAGGAGLAESLIAEAVTQVRAIEGQLSVRGPELNKEEKAVLEQEKQQAQMLGFSARESQAQIGMAGTALTARGSMAEASLFGVMGGGFAETAAMEREAQVKQIEADIAIKEKQRDTTPITDVGIKEIAKIDAEITSMKAEKVKMVAAEQAKLVAGTQAELQAREQIYKTYDVKSPELILKLQKEQLTAAEKLVAIETDPQRKKQLGEQVKAQAESVKYFEAYGKIQMEAEQAGQILQMERSAYGVTGAGTKSEQLGLSLVQAESVLASKMPDDKAGIAIAQALVDQLTIQKRITDEIEKRQEINQFDLNITDKQIQRMQTLRAPIGIIASLNRQKLDQNKEALKIAEHELSIAKESKDEQAARVAQSKVEDVKNAIAASIDFERRSYAEMFTETSFGKLGGGTYLFPNDVSKFATMGSGYTTGQTGYGQKGGTYQTQIAEMFGAGVDERTSIEKLYGSLVSDGIKLQEGATFKITGMDNGVATMVKEADRP